MRGLVRVLRREILAKPEFPALKEAPLFVVSSQLQTCATDLE